MADSTRSRTLDATTNAVWAVLADFGSIDRWAPNVDHSSVLRHPTDGEPDGLGLTRRIQIGRRVILERVVRWDEPEALAYEIEGLPKVIRSARNQWTLEPSGATSTLARLTSTIDCGPRPPQQLIARIVARRLATDSETMLSGLAHHLERHHG